MDERFETFTLLMTRISRSIRRLKADEMKKWGLKPHHVSCLYYLFRDDSLTATELCDLCGEDKAAISRAIESLEEDGYLECTSKLQKRYRSPLLLTEKGRNVGMMISKSVDRILDITAEGVSNEERKTMYNGLEKICLSLESICDSDSENQ